MAMQFSSKGPNTYLWGNGRPRLLAGCSNLAISILHIPWHNNIALSRS